MKKVLLVLISAVSLLAIACGANATKPEDLKESVYDEKTGKANSSTIQAAAGTAILADTFGTIDGTPVIVTDAAVYQIQEDGTLKDVTASKDIAGGYLYSITPSVTGSVIISYTYRKPGFGAKTESVNVTRTENYRVVKELTGKNYYDVNQFDTPNAIGSSDFNFIGITSVSIYGNQYTYSVNSLSPNSMNQFTTYPKLNAVDGAMGGDFINKQFNFGIDLSYNTPSTGNLYIELTYEYTKEEMLRIPDLAPIKEGTLESSAESVVVEDASFKKGQIYYYAYYDMNDNATSGGTGRINESGKITLSTPQNVKYKLWVF